MKLKNEIQILKDILDKKITYKNTIDLDFYYCNIPLDYKILLECIPYDNLYFNEFFVIFHLYNDYSKVATQCFSYSIIKKNFPKDYPFNIYPQDNGILACGCTDNGDEIYWRTDNWNIIVYETRSNIYYEYNMGIVEFIYKILTKNFDCPIFNND